MNTSGEKNENLIPVNCFWVGGSFLEHCVRQGWMVKRRQGRSTRYYCTPAGVDALKAFGIAILPPAERKRKPRAKPTRDSK